MCQAISRDGPLIAPSRSMYTLAISLVPVDVLTLLQALETAKIKHIALFSFAMKSEQMEFYDSLPPYMDPMHGDFTCACVVIQTLFYIHRWRSSKTLHGRQYVSDIIPLFQLECQAKPSHLERRLVTCTCLMLVQVYLMAGT